MGFLIGEKLGSKGGFSTEGSGTPYGNIFTDDFARAALGGNYAQNGGKFSTDGSKLNVIDGAGVFTNYMVRTANPTCLEHHTITANFKCTSTLSASTHGLGFGVRSGNPNDVKSYTAQVVCTSGIHNGKISLWTGTGATTPTYTNRLLSAQLVVINQNDLLQVVVQRDLLRITFTIYNLTLGTSGTTYYDFSLVYAAGAFAAHNTGYYCIQAIGGVHQVTNLSVSSTALKNARALFRGDSITYGTFADTIAERWSNLSMGSSSNFTVIGGGSDKTAEFLLEVPEIIALNPAKVFLMIGGNDITYSIPVATRNANYLAGVNLLKAAGIRVIHCLATPRTPLDITSWNTHLQTTYGSTDTIIDTFTPLWSGVSYTANAAYVVVDGVHPNAAGNALIGATVLPYI